MPATLASKLQLRPGHKLLLQNAPKDAQELLEKEIEILEKEIEILEAGKADAVLLFVNDLAESKKLAPKTFKAAPSGGLEWIAYPKGTSKVKTDVNRDKLWQALEPTGWQPVRQIALDDTWSAMRFRPADEVGK